MKCFQCIYSSIQINKKNLLVFYCKYYFQEISHETLHDACCEYTHRTKHEELL